MAYSSAADIDAIKTLYAVYITDITHDVTATENLYKAQAEAALNQWADAELAAIRINPETVRSYSSNIGGSYQKKTLAEVRAEAQAALDEFIRVCSFGGVNVPISNPSVSYYDMSRPVSGV